MFWYISSLPEHPIEITINDEHSIKPLLERPLARPRRPGIQRVRLEETALRLKPGVEYQWFIALVVDADSRSKDIIAGGWLERIERTDELQQKLSGAQRAEVPFIYAESGLWYDTVQAISDLIAESPDDPTLRQQRATLLEQVGLTEIATSDRNSISGE